MTHQDFPERNIDEYIENGIKIIPDFFINKYSDYLSNPKISSESVDFLIEKTVNLFSNKKPIFISKNALCIFIVNNKFEIIAHTSNCQPQDFKKIDEEYIKKTFLQSKVSIDPLFLSIYVPANFIEIWEFPKEIGPYKNCKDFIYIFIEKIGELGAITATCSALGLRQSHHRVIAAVISQGTIKAAAQHIGISHQRARAIIGEALASIKCSNIQELITTIATHAFGLSDRYSNDVVTSLREMWGLTERQAALAVLIAQGYQRTAAASYLQISQAVLKKEMSALYGSLGINSAIQLSVRLACLRFQKKFESSDSIFGEIHDQDDETLQFEYDDTGRRIAYSDYGPRDGFPVFFVHSSMTSRYVPRALRRSLRSRGFRVISIDRPGFGHTSKAIWGQFEQAAKDFCLVQDRLRVKPAHAVARGGAQFLLALAGQRPDALSGVVVINPDPVSNKSLKTVGPLGAVKEYFIRSPFMIQAFARITSKYLTPDRLNRWMEKSFESSASDSKVIKSIEVREDYWRSVKGFCAGSIDGYVAEQVEMATRSDINCPESKFLWSFMIGADDVLHDSYDNSEYWRHLVPGSQVKIIENSGRLLAFSHPEIVTEHLENIHSNLFSKSY